MNELLAIGVDGGGTKTAAWLAKVSPSGSPEILGKGISGSSNVNAVGWEQAISHLDQAINAAWQDAQRKRACATVAVLALSGAGRAETKAALIDWAGQHNLASRTEVIHDAQAVLWAGTAEAWGVALIAGTGAVALAKGQQEDIRVVGGWGYWFGDEGSAYWLGQSALRAVSQAADNRGPATSLTSAILGQLGVDNPREMLAALSHDSRVRHNIASLAPLVIQKAETGDNVATKILEQGGRQLARLIQSAAQQSELGTSFPLAMAGGVLCGSALMRKLVVQELSEVGIYPSLIELVADPVVGALTMASQLCSQA